MAKKQLALRISAVLLAASSLLASCGDSPSCSSIHRRFCRTLGITAYFQLNNSIWF